MTKVPRDIGASVRARLLNVARQRGEDFQLVLTRYANERFLYRLANSPHASKFVLKGATLFTVWTGEPHRATRDIDLLGFGDRSDDHVRSAIASILELEVEDDGVRFESSSIQVEPIRGLQEYGGVRLTLLAHVTTAKVRLQIDIGFGDVVTPKAVVVTFPTLLDYPSPTLRAYPRETVVAEKLEAMVKLGQANTRMKDFYDLETLAGQFAFDGAELVRAISATFAHRATSLPPGLPVALTAEFTEDRIKMTQWTAFLRKSGASDLSSLSQTADRVARFVQDPVDAGHTATTFDKQWVPGGPWRSTSGSLS